MDNKVKEFIENLDESSYDKEKILSTYKEMCLESKKIDYNNSFHLYENIRYSINKYYELIFEALCKLNVEEVIFSSPIMALKSEIDNNHSIYIKKIKFKRPQNPLLWIRRLEVYLKLICDIHTFKKDVRIDYELSINDFEDDIFTLSKILDELNNIINEKEYNESYPKTITVKNKDIIITDPCYIQNRSKEKFPVYISFDINHDMFDTIKINGWKEEDLTMQQILEAYNNECAYNSLLLLWNKLNSNKYCTPHWSESEHIKNYITSNTIYGDWSCTTFNSDTNEPIGEFCADAGEVGVFVLDEILKYNPEFDYHINKPWTTTLIKDFTGEISIVKRHNEGIYKDKNKYHKKGEKWEEDSIHVVGKGNINFETKQTGF